MAGDTEACICVEVAGAGLMACIVVEEGLRHALFACCLMDAILTHLWAMLAHPLHRHMSLWAGFPTHPLVQDKAPFTRVAVGSISFTCSAGRTAAFTSAIFHIEALRALGEASAFMEEEGVVWLCSALFAKIGVRAGGTVLCTVLTAATPR